MTQKTVKEVKNSLPLHLQEFIVEQDVTQYTPVDHAVWRYSLRQLKNFLSTAAHESYLDGLEKTGITVDEIPSIDSICAKLSEFGWSAIPVSGFIPPAAFMEMQSLGVLPIASDMRSIDHILYTPAPDIVHEAAGHAPILINPQFAAYLKEYAKVAKNAIVSHEDLALYEAIRELSDIKENPDSSDSDIQEAETKLESVAKAMTVTSEATLLGRMNWWTAEYGLIGSMDDPKIYGAGLLSSYGESKECLKDPVKKIKLGVDCIDYNYDITEPQPQLFVAESFEHLKTVLHDFSQQMAYKQGGIIGLKKAIEAKTVNTVQLNSGLQASGIVVDYIEEKGHCTYFRLEGPTQLCVGGHELPGHNKDYHAHGFSSPLGLVEGRQDCLSWASDQELMAMGLHIDKPAELKFRSGVLVKGILKGKNRTPRGELCLLTFENCTVTYNDKILFDPDWGVFDMAVGTSIESVFSGPADRRSYGLTDSFPQKLVPKRSYSQEEQSLHEIYQSIRNLRDSGTIETSKISALHHQVAEQFPEEWLSRLELLELSHSSKATELIDALTVELRNLKDSHPQFALVIEDGIKIADQKI